MTDPDFSYEEFRELLSITRRVIPAWLRKHHSTLSLASQAVESLYSDAEIRSQFLEAMKNSEKEVVFRIWRTFSFRIRDRLKKRISRRKEENIVVDAQQIDDDLVDLLDHINSQLEDSFDAQCIFRELYLPLVDCTVRRRPSVSAVQSLLGGSEVWAKAVRAQVEDAILSACSDTQ